MLHAFRADNGTEIFGFIPGPIFSKLTGGGVTSKDLTSPSYTHQYFVDGIATMGDVFYNNAWHTVLVGGLNKGGQGLYALDITDPAGFTEAGAANIVQWEFTDTTDADLGYTFSQPSIVRLHNGKWAAVFGTAITIRRVTAMRARPVTRLCTSSTSRRRRLAAPETLLCETSRSS